MKPLIFYTRPIEEREAMISKFWEDYFRNNPERGTMPELNEMRMEFRKTGRVRFDWKEWRQSQE